MSSQPFSDLQNFASAQLLLQFTVTLFVFLLCPLQPPALSNTHLPFDAGQHPQLQWGHPCTARTLRASFRLDPP